VSVRFFYVPAHIFLLFVFATLIIIKVVPPGGGGGYQPQLKRPKSQRAKRHYGKMGWLPINTTKIQEEIDLEAKDEAENFPSLAYYSTDSAVAKTNNLQESEKEQLMDRLRKRDQYIMEQEFHSGLFSKSGILGKMNARRGRSGSSDYMAKSSSTAASSRTSLDRVEHETSELLMNRLENYLLLKDKIQHKFTQSREKELANSRETLEKDCSEFTLLRPTSTAAGSENRIPGIMTMETKIKRRRRLLRPERKITIINQMNSSNLDDDENAAPVSSTGIDQSDRKMSKKYTNEKRQSLNVVSPDSLPAVAGGIDEDEHGSTTSSGTDGIAT